MAARVVVGTLAGMVPGALLLVATIPVSGEAELTLGMGGATLAAAGAITGALVAAAGTKRERR